MTNEEIYNWLESQYCVSPETIIEALKLSPSAQGYIHGAVSELMLIEYLKNNDFEVHRIKEKPAGGYDEKKEGYKGDFLIKKKNTNDYYVIECKGLKTNSEFRTADTDNNHEKRITRKQAFDCLKKFINIDKQKIYESGLKRYNKTKRDWEQQNPGKIFPDFKWNKDNAGPDNANLTNYFNSLSELKQFIENSDSDLLTEQAFRNRNGLYKILQTHKPSTRKDVQTGIEQAAPLVSDFSILAVDLFLRTGKHQFVFMNPDKISHSPSSPNHLYQNYIIDIIIPGIKNSLDINYPWFSTIDSCISESSPKKVEYDESQIDFREA